MDSSAGVSWGEPGGHSGTLAAVVRLGRRDWESMGARFSEVEPDLWAAAGQISGHKFLVLWEPEHETTTKLAVGGSAESRTVRTVVLLHELAGLAKLDLTSELLEVIADRPVVAEERTPVALGSTLEPEPVEVGGASASDMTKSAQERQSGRRSSSRTRSGASPSEPLGPRGSSTTSEASAQHPQVEDELQWILIVHPDPEVAQARAKLVQEAYPGAGVSHSTRLSDALRAGGSPAGGRGLVAVHVEGIDRFRRGWGGHRALERLSNSGVPALAWVSSQDRDGRALAERLGLHALTVATFANDPRAEFADEIRAAVVAVVKGLEPTHQSGFDSDAFRDFERWFEARYASKWMDWMEPILTGWLGGAPSADQAEALEDRWGHGIARRRMRDVRRLVSGDAGVLTGADTDQEAVTILRRLSEVRPIESDPIVYRSLYQASRLLASDPSIATEARLSDSDVRLLARVAAVEAQADQSQRPIAGRPAGNWAMNRRRWAIGRVAHEQGRLTNASSADADLRSLTREIDALVEAVYDVLADRDRVGRR